MTLLGNHYRQGASPTINHIGANQIGAYDRQQAYLPGRVRAGYVSSAKGGIAQQQAYPVGNGFDTAWLLNPKAGGIAWRPVGVGTIGLTGLAGRLMLSALSGSGDLTAARTEAILRTLLSAGSGTLTAAIEGRAPLSIDFDGTGDLTGTIVGLVELAVALAGSGDLDPDLAGVVQAIVAWSGSSAFTADIAGLSQMLASFAGSGGITLNMLGRFAMLVALSGAGDLDATAFGTAHPAVALTGSGDLDALIRAFGDMSVDIVVTGSGLSTTSIAQAVWSALASANNDPNTMGQKLNDAGSAGNPWNSIIEAGLTAEEVLRIIAAAVAGASEGAPDGPIVFKGLDGTTERITGDVDADGNRSNVVVDGQ